MCEDNLKKEVLLPGELIDVKGRKVHVQRSGTGSPTVVFEAGLFANSLTFAKVQPQISKLTSTLSYDRAGMGYSEPSPNLKRVSAVFAKELFELLDAIDLYEPVVLVGWSAGGIYIREFAHQHPNMVAGMVFIDSSHENQENRYPEELAPIEKKSFDGTIDFFTRLSKMTHEEILKELEDSPPWQSHHPDTHKYFADLARPAILKYWIHLGSFFKEDTTQGENALRSLGDIPLIVISATKYDDLNMNDEQKKLATKNKHELHSELARLSTVNRQMKVDSGHNISKEKPEIVIEAIEEMVKLVRGAWQ